MTNKSKPSIMTKENLGIETIPEGERSYRPIHIFTTLTGCNLSLTKLVFGAIPILLGLGWWEALFSVIVGAIIGSSVLAPMALPGPKTGTNNPVASTSNFGVEGRLIGSIIGVLVSVGFIAIAIWQCGGLLSNTVSRLFEFDADSTTAVVQPITFLLIGLIVITIAIRGVHAVMHVQSKFMIPIIGFLFVVAVFAFAPHFDSGYTGKGLTGAEFWVVFFTSAFLTASSMVSFSTYIGDWTRYMPANTSKKSLVMAGFAGGMGDAIPMIWAVFIVTCFAGNAADFLNSFVMYAPVWFLPAIIIMALAGGVAQCGIALYSVGLDTSSLFPSLRRVQATLAIGAASVVLVFLGVYVWDATTAVIAFLGVLLTVAAPWAVIFVIGYFHVKGYYYPDDIQVFTRNQHGGRYWYTGGWNIKACVSWFFASLIGALFGNYDPLFVGPFHDAFGGLDLGFVIAMVIAGLLYTGLLLAFKTPSYVFGPEGPGFGKTLDNIEPPAITPRNGKVNV